MLPEKLSSRPRSSVHVIDEPPETERPAFVLLGDEDLPRYSSEDYEELAYWRRRDMALDHDHCFLCGVELTAANRTDEHVVPKWLLRDFDLWDLELTLMNRTRIRYRGLTIPCCRECNTFWLSQVEDVVASAFRVGPEAVRALDRELVVLWLAKIYYGIHFKELALPMDRSDPTGRTIITPGYLGEISEIHHVLQALRRRVRFTRPLGSSWIFEAQVPNEPRWRFDYRDAWRSSFAGIRVGPTVLVASLLDWGLMERELNLPPFDISARMKLHPFQFLEITAYGSYVSGRLNREFGYLASPQGDHDDIRPVVLEYVDGPRPDREYYDPYEIDEYAKVLAEFTGLPLNRIFNAEKQQLWTSLHKPDRSPAFLSIDEAPPGSKMVPPGWNESAPDWPEGFTLMNRGG